MTEYLIFTLAAPIASFGAVAVGERRPTWDRPSKSQVLGLVAGALGIERGEEARHLDLAQTLSLAVRIDSAGTIQTDYHTTQVPPTRRNRRFATRADELAVDKTELRTILSRRELRVASFYTIALSATSAATLAHPLSEIKAALENPVFVPFAGRKANVLMLPMAPRLVVADDISTAFTAYDMSEPETQKKLRQAYWLVPKSTDGRIYADAESVPRQLTDRIEQRRDIPESRTKWRFGLRSEALVKSTPPGGRP
jgi:CRISPR system Cascade subunit CasD